MIQAKARNTISEKKVSKREKRLLSKMYTELKRISKRTITNCLICGQECTSYCDSHSIPKFVLKQISKNGKILIGHNFVQNPVTDEYGISNALVFKCVCNKCDNTYFQEYENLSVFEKPLSNLAINEIATKIYLRHYYKRFEEESIFLELNQEVKKNGLEGTYAAGIINNKLLTTQLDLEDAKRRIRKLIKHKNEKHFYVIDDFNLDYPAQLTYQGFIALTKGFGKTINDIYNYNPSYRIEVIYLCVFPFKGGTKIVLFCDDGATRLRDFYKTYRKLNLDSKLYLLNYILLLYDEEWCVSGDFDKTKLNWETLKLINQTTDINVGADSLSEIEEHYDQLKRQLIDGEFELKTSGNIYNFLINKEK